MSFGRKRLGRTILATILALGAGTAGVLVAGVALAKPGTVNLTTYLRAGAGEQFAALDEIDPEDQVDVQSCANGWCRVVSGSATGYIEESVLSAPDFHRQPAAAAATDCFTARLNGPPRSADAVRICRK